ncbi:hypothetical protein [Cryobacterium sp. PH31-L1]|nr:hypothetical protein [Cryobacterium sp. PH31-L1]MDJ0376962.1 hypothetical protein [Cryobacterium sp. PH31-L1]
MITVANFPRLWVVASHAFVDDGDGDVLEPYRGIDKAGAVVRHYADRVTA